MKKIILRICFAVLFTAIGFGGAVWANAKKPFPIPEWGHRAYRVADEQAAAVTIVVLEKTSNLKASWAFDFGPSHHVLMNDGLTEIVWFDGNIGDDMPNAISLAVDNPEGMASLAKDIYRHYAFKAESDEPFRPDAPENNLVRVKNNAMIQSGLVYRLPVIPWPWNNRCMPTPKERPIPVPSHSS